MKKIRILFHKWHNWVGIVLSIPVLIVSISAILIAFADEFKTDEVKISASIVPGYYFESTKETILYELKDSKGILVSSDTFYVGTKAGLIIKTADKTELVKQLSGFEIRKIAKLNGNIYAAGKSGLWIKTFTGWNKLIDKDVHEITKDENGNLYAAIAKGGIITSKNNFKNYSNLLTEEILSDIKQSGGINQSDYFSKQEVSLKDLILHLHTGRAFFGKSYEWIWINLVGASITILVVTGGYLWLRKKIRKAKN